MPENEVSRKQLREIKLAWTRREAERAAVALSCRIADPAAQADPSLDALKSARTSGATRSLLAVLGGIGGAKAFAAVEAAVADKRPEVRDAAVRALADWPDARAVEALLAIYRTTANQTHQVLALRGGVRLLGLGGRPVKETLAIYGDLLRRVLVAPR